MASPRLSSTNIEPLDKTSSVSLTEHGQVVPLETADPPKFIVINTGGDNETSRLLGKIEEKQNIAERKLNAIESKLDDITERLKSIEAIVDILETIPKFGEAIKHIREKKKLI